jgi:putative colanic acid biosynthesis acetyltransferase WcaF
MTAYLDNAAHRRNANYSRGELWRRRLWECVAWKLRWTPRCCYGLRNAILRAFGARLGRAVRIYPDARIFHPWLLQVGDCSTIGPGADIYNLGEVRIGANVLISKNAHLCAGSHDYRQPNLPLLKLPITIGDEVWICADAFIGPGVTVGRGAVLGARAVVLRDVPEGAIVGGNPARAIGRR